MTRTWWLLPAALLAALAFAWFAWRSRWRATVLWAGAALVGYAATLQLIDAGPTVRYQHYLTPAAWLHERPIAAVVVLAYLVLIATGLARYRERLAALAAGWRGAALAAAAAASVLTSATLSASPGAYLLELLVAGTLQAAHLGAALLAGLAAPDDGARSLCRSVDGVLTPPPEPAPDRFAWIVAGAAVLVPAVLALLVYQRHPHVPDEVAYLLHARYFAAGRLWLPLPEPYAAFDVDLMFADGSRWYSPVPPGWPAILAAGVAAGVPWLVNPILNGLNVLLVHRLSHELYEPSTARLTVLVFAFSPWNLFLAMSLLSHTASLAAALAAALGVVAFRRGGRVPLLVPAGAAIGIVALIRPLEGLIVAVCLGLWALGARPWGRALRGAVVLAAAAAATGSLTLWYNRALTGVASRFPIMAYADAVYGPGSNAMGFGPNRGLGWGGLDPLPGHGPLDVLINTNLNLFAFNIELLGWATGSVLVLALWILRGRLDRADRTLLAAISAVVLAHAFYWFAGGPDFGARYWYLIAAPCTMLAARALQGLPEGAGPVARGRFLAGAAALAAGCLLVFVPWRAGDKYYHYRGMEPGLRTLLRSGTFGADLVLVRGRRHPDYAAAAVLNTLPPDPGQPVFAWDQTPEVRRAVLERFHDRQVWLVNGPTETGAGYRIVLGPVAAAELLSP